MCQKTVLDWNLVQVCTMVYILCSLYCEHQNLQTNLPEERAPHYTSVLHMPLFNYCSKQNKIFVQNLVQVI